MISFIIPVYNNAKTIERAINSILNQENNNLDYEIIVVNDCSTDNLDEIMEKYENNNKIQYLKKENNTGLSDTRNYGMKYSKGDYIIFVDSDDYISNCLLKEIEPYILNETELIKWSPIYVDENGKKLTKTELVEFKNVTGEEGFNNLFGKDNLIECVWNYAIHKELVPKFPVRSLS